MLNHKLEDFSQQLVLGKNHQITSTGVFKRAMLTGYLSILVLGICLFYLVFDAYMGMLNATLYYLTLVNFAVIAFFLNRTGKYSAAKYLLLLSTLLIISMFSISEPMDSGNYFSFFPLTLASFALFGYDQLYKGVIFSLVIIVAFLVIYNVDINILPERSSAPEMAGTNFMVHFFISLIASILIIIFLIKLNQTIESNLRQKDQNLLTVASDLEESKQRFELAINGSNAGIYDWDISNNTIYHSPKWKQLLDYDADELEEFTIETFFEFVHPNDVEKLRLALDKHLADGEPYSAEFRLKNKHGKYLWFADSGQALWNEDGIPIRMVGSIIKTHDRKVAEEQIKQQNRMLEKTNLELDNFVYSASHDIRSPLTSILGLLNIAERTNDREEIEECHRLMRSRIDRLDDFLEDILDFSRNLRMDEDPKEINLYYFINDLINNLDFVDEMEDMDIRLMIPRDFVVNSDPLRLKIILKNIISNSVKFRNVMQDTQWLRISTLRVDDRFQLIIEDNGEGIRKELKKKIFQMFYRASEKSKGSGLGLYIVKEMVDKLDGSIAVNSSYGEGSQFIVELPNHKSLMQADNVDVLAKSNGLSPRLSVSKSFSES
jgi:PAS domain S-box-containing protein